MSKVRTVSRLALFLFLAVFATTAMSGESATPSGKVSIESRLIAAGIGVTWGDGKSPLRERTILSQSTA